MSVYQLAAAEIEDRIAAGERVRSDGFFADEDEDRSAGEEAWESVLSKCRQDPAERKLPYMAHLLAGIAFETRVDGDTAHQVIAAAEQLTYRQLCIMRLARTSNMYSLADGYRGQVNFSEDLFASLHECVDLYQRAFVRFGGEMVFDVSDVKPSEITLHGLGILLHGLMKLSDIPDEDVAKVALPMRPE